MKKTTRRLSAVLSLALSTALLASCSGTGKTGTSQSGSGTGSAPSTPTTSGSDAKASASGDVSASRDKDGGMPLVQAVQTLSGKFSTFFGESVPDRQVYSMTSLGVLTNARGGEVIYNGIKGETVPYGGKDYTYYGPADVKVERTENQTVYTYKLRDDLKFSDGEPLTADDAIFTLYTLLDPTYTGFSTTSSLPIVGLKAYRTQTSEKVYEAYGKYYDEALKGRTDEQHNKDAWTLIDPAFEKALGDDVKAVVGKYAAAHAESVLGIKGDEVAKSEELSNAFYIALQEMATVSEDRSTLTLDKTGVSFDLKAGKGPTAEQLKAELEALYPDIQELEKALNLSFTAPTREDYIFQYGSKDSENAEGGVPNIEGIKKIDEHTYSVTLNGFDAAAIYRLAITIAPMHYYGDKNLYNYEKNQFGFKYRDLKLQHSKTDKPMGAGPYIFERYDNKVAYFRANPYYYQGEPKIKHVQLKETNGNDMVPALLNGTADVSEPNFTNEAVDAIKNANGNGELTGPKLKTISIDTLGYGYIGINADTVKVGEDPASDASKNLRRALTTILSVNRQVSVESFYGDRAKIINYPISNTSWAAPKETDQGYREAYSLDVEGKDIYTSGMKTDERIAAAEKAAIGFLKAAGYTFDEASGKFTAAPEGASLEYEIIVPGEGSGAHPSFLLVTNAREQLAKIGINLIINDPTDSNELWNKLRAGTQELWAAAWGATIDPDMYQVYHSNNIVGKPGASGSNHYHIQDAQLDSDIMEARTSEDQTFRKALYKNALDRVIDWAVEIPVYQRQNCNLFSAERIKLDTLPQDLTPFYGWGSEIQNLEMNEG